MVVLRVDFQGQMCWAVSPDDPLLFPLESLPAWSLLSPAVYPDLECAAPPMGEFKAKATFIVDGLFYFVSGGFLLVSQDNKPDQSLDFWMHHVPAFAAHLRSESKQAPLSPKLTGVGPTNVTLPTSIVLPHPGD